MEKKKEKKKQMTKKWISKQSNSNRKTKTACRNTIKEMARQTQRINSEGKKKACINFIFYFFKEWERKQ